MRDLFFAYRTAKSTYLDFELESPKIVGPSLPHDRSGKHVLLGNSSCLRPLAWLWLVLFLVMFLSPLWSHCLLYIGQRLAAFPWGQHMLVSCEETPWGITWWTLKRHEVQASWVPQAKHLKQHVLPSWPALRTPTDGRCILSKFRCVAYRKLFSGFPDHDSRKTPFSALHTMESPHVVQIIFMARLYNIFRLTLCEYY